MSSEIITKNDLKAILDTALPTQPVLSDTGWLDPTFTSAFRNYPDTGQYVKYRRVGKIVEIRGAAQPTAEIAGSDTTVTMFTLPLGFRPATRLVRVMQGSGACIWLMTIETSGEVGFVRYRNGASYTAAANSAWLAMSTTFTVENDDWPVTPVTTADYIVEQGTSGIWTYRKWNSGIAECWGRVINCSIPANWSTTGVNIALPFIFKTMTNWQIQHQNYQINNCYGYPTTVTNTYDNINIQTNASAALSTAAFMIFCQGTWK